MGQIKVFVQELWLKQEFLADTNMDYLTSERPGMPNFKVDANFESMGKHLQDEPWARPVPSKLSECRPPTLFLGADTENGQKRYFFAFLPITQMQKFSRGIRGCQMKADVLEVQKMW